MATLDLSYLLEQARDLSRPDAEDGAEEVAEVALQLARLSAEIGEHLEPLKERLRHLALPLRSSESNRVNIQSEGGQVQVTFPDATLKLASKYRSLSPDDLREVIGDGDLYEECFEEVLTVKPRKGLGDRLRARLAGEATGADSENRRPLSDVLAYLDMKESTPRVGFRPNPDILDL